ncbi:MAG TPA: PTS sugar transporter subunit IIA [Candidatus Krumholzibacteria bacterium]|nr:PTS sugar transporter subunit IIA [Candidatus Krumholzibacteria bacterium]
MRLTELIQPATVVTGLASTSGDELLTTVVADLDARGLVEDREAALHDLLARERVMSTGVGHGVAIPHAYTNGVRRLIVGLYRTREPIPFGAPDDAGVDMFFVVLGPKASRRDHIRVLARISRLIGHADFREDLRRAEGADAVIAVLRRFGER